MDITFPDALRAWTEGLDISQRELWGIRILWWGRLGALVQLISAMVVVIDLVGAERLRLFGLRLHSDLGAQGARNRMFRGRRWYVLHRKFRRLPSDTPEEDRALDRASESPFNRLAIGLWIAVLGLGVFWAWPNTWLVVLVLCVGTPLIVWGAPELAFWLAHLGNSCGVAIDRLVVAPFANLMGQENRGRILSLVSLLALLFGSLLSMLAS